MTVIFQKFQQLAITASIGLLSAFAADAADAAILRYEFEGFTTSLTEAEPCSLSILCQVPTDIVEKTAFRNVRITAQDKLKGSYSFDDKSDELRSLSIRFIPSDRSGNSAAPSQIINLLELPKVVIVGTETDTLSNPTLEIREANINSARASTRVNGDRFFGITFLDSFSVNEASFSFSDGTVTRNRPVPNTAIAQGVITRFEAVNPETPVSVPEPQAGLGLLVAAGALGLVNRKKIK